MIKSTMKKIKKTSMRPEEGYIRMVEWMYLFDGKFNDKNQWRTEFLRKLSEIIKAVGGKTHAK